MTAPILALSGGVGGAKLAVGLAQVLPPEELICIANCGDDFKHLGLLVCPDLDSLMYALAGDHNETTGWGRRGESWNFLEALKGYGGEDWFALGDRDLATHVWRTHLLSQGLSLTEVTARLCAALGIGCQLLPMSDSPVHTWVQTSDGEMPFQHYFVRERCLPQATGFRFQGIEQAAPNPLLLKQLASGVRGIVICPSNPYVSIDPILQLAGLRQALAGAQAPVVAVSPIIGGQAVKGPAAKMMKELGFPASPLTVAQCYGDLLDGFVLDQQDKALAPEISALGNQTLVTQTLMTDRSGSRSLAAGCLKFIDHLRAGKQPS